jgi:hypothetical protein
MQSVCAEQGVRPPQTFGVASPPHVAGAVHVPQSSVPPQPSGIMPQFAPFAWQVVLMQPHTFDVPPPPHVSEPVQDPQLRGCGHVPLEIVPQLACWALHVVGVQHTPNGFEPGGAPFTHAPLQQL